MRNKVINVIKYGITAIAIINLILMFGFNYRILGIDFLEYVRGNQNQIQYVSSTAETAATAEAAEEIEEKEPEPEPEKMPCHIKRESARSIRTWNELWCSGFRQQRNGTGGLGRRGRLDPYPYGGWEGWLCLRRIC